MLRSTAPEEERPFILRGLRGTKRIGVAQLVRRTYRTYFRDTTLALGGFRKASTAYRKLLILRDQPFGRL